MIDPLSMSSSLCSKKKKKPRHVCFLNICMPACLDCLFSSRLLVVFSTCFVFCQVSVFFSDSFSLVVVVSYLLSCLSGFVWQASCCFPPHLSWWPLTTHRSCKISTWHFSRLPGEFSVSSQTLCLCFPYSFPAAVLPLSFPSLSLLLYCFHFDFSCLPPHPSTLSSSCFFPHRFTSFSLPFYSAVSPLPVVSTFSPSHSFSTRVSLYLTSNFPRCTLTCHHHNLLLAPTSPYLSPSLPLFYASILSFICSLSPSPTLPLAGVSAY